MATFVLCHGFVEHAMNGVHNLSSHDLGVALSANLPGEETSNPARLTADCILANVTQISYTNLSSRTLTKISAGQTSGVYTYKMQDLTLTASGAVPTFRTVYVFNISQASPANPLLGYYDYGPAGVTMATGEKFRINVTDVNSIFLRLRLFLDPAVAASDTNQ